MKRSYTYKLAVLYLVNILIMYAISAICALCHFSDQLTMMVEVCGEFLFVYTLNRFWIKSQIFLKSNIPFRSQISVNTVSFILVLCYLIAIVDHGTFSEKFMLSIISALLFAITEEYLFRGIILGSFLRQFNFSMFTSVIFCSLLFGMTHLMNLTYQSLTLTMGQILSAAALGIIFCCIYLRTRSLLWPIGLHFVVDVSAGASSLAKGTYNIPVSPYYSIISLLLSVCLMLFLLRKSKQSQVKASFRQN